MRFSLERSKQASFFRTRKFAISLQLFYVFAIFFVVIYGSATKFGKAEYITSVIFLTAFIIASSVFIHRQKSFSNFEVNDSGIEIQGQVYPWSRIRSYHWYGEMQNERVGIVSLSRMSYDPIDPNKFAGTQIARLRVESIFPRYIALEVESSQAETLKSLFDKYAVRHTSWLRRFVGLN